MARAVEEVNKLLVPQPEGEDELKRKQLMELAIINGTFRNGAGTPNGTQQGGGTKLNGATPLLRMCKFKTFSAYFCSFFNRIGSTPFTVRLASFLRLCRRFCWRSAHLLNRCPLGRLSTPQKCHRPKQFANAFGFCSAPDGRCHFSCSTKPTTTTTCRLSPTIGDVQWLFGYGHSWPLWVGIGKYPVLSNKCRHFDWHKWPIRFVGTHKVCSLAHSIYPPYCCFSHIQQTQQQQQQFDQCQLSALLQQQQQQLALLQQTNGINFGDYANIGQIGTAQTAVDSTGQYILVSAF